MTNGRYGRGSVLQVDTGSNAELVKVLRVASAGPYGYELTVRPLTRLDRAWSRLAAWALRLPRYVARRRRDWLASRCDQNGCWRKAAIEDEDYDAWCGRHAAGREVRDGA